MLPIGDDNPTRITPFVNWAIILSCILTFLWQTSKGTNHFIYTLMNFGIVPARIAAGEGLYTFVTNIFLHGGWAHLLGNMLFLWIFGDNIEDNIICRSISGFKGRLYYLGFYFICGITASALWMITAWESNIPAVGASGAIAGVLGAYFVFYPNRRVKTLIGFGFFWRVLRVRAFTMIGLWFVYQFFMAFYSTDVGIAFWAHIGGFIMGLILALFIRTCPRVIETYYASDLDNYR